MRSVPRPARDKKLVQIVDAALAEAAEKAGSWLACREGCAQCCYGAFRINQLDVARLQEGMRHLKRRDPKVAGRVEQRAREWIARNKAEFPGSITTGTLGSDPPSEQAFDAFANDEPCPALDPHTLTCDVYEFRPMTCRVFGPPVRTQDGLGMCELCFQGAPEAEIHRCEMRPDPEDLESKVLKSLPAATRNRETVVAFALLPPSTPIR